MANPHGQFANFAAAVVRQLGALNLDSDVMQAWIENQDALARVLSSSLGPLVGSFRRWKILTVCGYEDADRVRHYLKRLGMHLSGWAYDILSKVMLPKEAQVVELVCVPPRDLGFTHPARLRDIFVAAMQRGLKLCQPEDGVAARSSYPDQPRGQSWTLAMNPILDSEGLGRMLSISHNSAGNLCLDTDYRGLESFLDLGEMLLFRRP